MLRSNLPHFLFCGKLVQIVVLYKYNQIIGKCLSGNEWHFYSSLSRFVESAD